MKAIDYKKYGSPNVLKLQDIEKPIPKDDEVLVKVQASSINSWDWDRLTGKPYLYRLLSGITKPKLKVLGADIAGIVEQVGKNVTHIKAQDEVYGDMCEGNWGGFAEYVCANEKALIIKPLGMTFEQAAAIPQACVMALQGIRDQRQIKSGSKVLMNGAGGAVGSFAIQLAKLLGAHVTGVDGKHKHDFIKSCGADEVIDYKKENFTNNGQQYDLILDVVANRSVFEYKRALSEHGVYAMIGGKIPTVLQVVMLGPLLSKKGGKKIGILAHQPNKGLAYLNELFDAGELIPKIDKTFALHEVPDAFRYFEGGNFHGKIVIKI